MRPHQPAIDLAALAEQAVRTSVLTLEPYFPPAISPHEDVTLYRHSVQRIVRAWVMIQLSTREGKPISEERALQAVSRIAQEEIGRELHAIETRVLSEAVRDVLTAQQLMWQMVEEERTDLESRLHTPSRLFA